tara:strand:+ start:488 stop:934 length:447 start_codon:yes stop_codon:yes gene_type:complete
MANRECKKCGELKELDAFHLRTIYKGKPITDTSYKSICKSCVIKNVTEWKQKNKDKVRVADRKFRHREKDKLNQWKRDNYSAGGRSEKERETYRSNKDNLADVYIVGLLSGPGNSIPLERKEITSGLIKLKRRQLFSWRKLRNKVREK